MAAGKPAPRLLDEVRRVLRLKHYSTRTEVVYVGWIRRFVLANGKRHPRDMGAAEVEAFLSQLAVQGQVAASTQNQALSAILFLYREVLGTELPWIDGVVRAKRPQRVPTVLSREEVSRMLACMEGRPLLLASLLYGTGMRLMEVLRLRVKDVDFDRCEITVRDGKGGLRTVTPCCPARWSSRCAASWSVRRRCMLPILPRALVPCGCRTRWRASIRMRRASSAGSTCSLRPGAPSTRATGWSDGIISTTASCRVRSSGRAATRASASR
jgi:Site-specific recombinase XerD